MLSGRVPMLLGSAHQIEQSSDKAWSFFALSTVVQNVSETFSVTRALRDITLVIFNPNVSWHTIRVNTYIFVREGGIRDVLRGVPPPVAGEPGGGFSALRYRGKGVLIGGAFELHA